MMHPPIVPGLAPVINAIEGLSAEFSISTATLGSARAGSLRESSSSIRLSALSMTAAAPMAAPTPRVASQLGRALPFILGAS